MAETQTIPVAVLYVEIAATVGLVLDLPHDGDALRLEFRMKRIGIVHPNVRIPCSAFRIDGPVGTHETTGFKLCQHNDDSTAINHAEGRRVVPEALVLETEFVAIEIRGINDVIHNEIRCNIPA